MTTELNDENAQGGEEFEALSKGVGAPVFSGAATDFSSSSEEGGEQSAKTPVAPAATLLFQAPEIVRRSPRIETEEDEEFESKPATHNRSRVRKDDVSKSDESDESKDASDDEGELQTSRRRRRRRSSSKGETSEGDLADEVTGVKGSTRLEAKRQRRIEGRRENRRRQVVTESEFLARRESVKREMIVREKAGLNQIAVLEDGVLVEHYVARRTQQTMVGNIYLGRVQNVLPSMEAAFVDLGKGRNAVLYAGEVNWEALGFQGRPRRIEQALKSGDTVLVQVTKDPIGHKGARLTSQITLAGRFLVLVPDGQMTGISRKLPEKERARLKKLLSKIVPKDSGVIVRTAAEGATEKQLRDDVKRLQAQWEEVVEKQQKSGKAPLMLRSEPELAVRVVRDVFNEDFKSLTVAGNGTWKTIHEYVSKLSPDLKDRLVHWTKKEDVFASHRVDEQLAKGFDNKVWLPSGGSLIIDRTEAMTVIDVNTGKFIGSGGTLEETVTKNNLEAAEEIVRQLRLRDIGGIIVIDFVDMVLESNRDLVLRRLVECLGRDRTRHQVTEITALGLVQMTRKRVGEGLVEAFSTPCECCEGRGFIVHSEPVEKDQSGHPIPPKKHKKSETRDEETEEHKQVKAALSAIAASAASKHHDEDEGADSGKKHRKGRKSRKADSEASIAKHPDESPRNDEPENEQAVSARGSRQDSVKAKSAPSDSPNEAKRKRGARSVKLEVGEPKKQAQPTESATSAEEAPTQPAGKAEPASEIERKAGQANETPAERPARKRGRRSATLETGKPKIKLDLPKPVDTDKIARPAALSLDDIELPNAEDRPVKKSRRAVMPQPSAASGEES